MDTIFGLTICFCLITLVRIHKHTYIYVRIYRCTKFLHEYIHFKSNRTSSSSFYCPKNTVLTFYSTFNPYNCTLETVLKYLYLFFNL